MFPRTSTFISRVLPRPTHPAIVSFYKPQTPTWQNTLGQIISFQYIAALIGFLGFAFKLDEEPEPEKHDESYYIDALVLAPLVEETLFRGIPALILKRFPRVFLGISSIGFGLSHVQNYDPSKKNGFLVSLQVAMAGVSGLVMGRFYQGRKNLLACMAIHCAVNAHAVVVEYTLGRVGPVEEEA